jgi:hypothetical protein
VKREKASSRSRAGARNRFQRSCSWNTYSRCRNLGTGRCGARRSRRSFGAWRPSERRSLRWPTRLGEARGDAIGSRARTPARRCRTTSGYGRSPRFAARAAAPTSRARRWASASMSPLSWRAWPTGRASSSGSRRRRPPRSRGSCGIRPSREKGPSTCSAPCGSRHRPRRRAAERLVLESPSCSGRPGMESSGLARPTRMIRRRACAWSTRCGVASEHRRPRIPRRGPCCPKSTPA